MIATVTRMLASKRMWMHVPLGFANGVWLVLLPPLGMGLLLAFVAYELNQCSVSGDGAYQDILGHVVGIALAGLACTAALIALILWIGGTLAWR